MKTSGLNLEPLNKAGSGTHLEPSAECGAVFQALKIKRKHRYIVYKVEAETIEVEKASERNDTYASFKEGLPYTDCRFAIFAHEKIDPVRKVPVNKLFFVVWSPSNASTYNKVAYTAAKQKLMGAMGGSALNEIVVRSVDELDAALKEDEEEEEEDEDWMD